MARDYYEILGVSRDATQEDIKRAYRRLARECHPDVNRCSPEAEERFKELGEAYAVLSDPEKRRHYDLFGQSSPADFGFANGFPDIFEVFNQAFGFASGRPRRTIGRDLEYEVEIELEEVLTGATRKLEVARLVRCDTCRGSGRKPGSQPVACQTCHGAGQVRQVRNGLFGSMVTVTPCPTCGGSGAVIAEPCETCQGRGVARRRETMTVEVPPGIESGQHLQYDGYGEASADGGPPGDLYVRVLVAEHEHFVREGCDLRLRLPVAIWQAALGDTVRIPTLEREVEFEIPAGVQSGEEIRLPGKGLPGLRSRGRGDQIVTITVTTPQDLTPDQRRLFEELAQAFGDRVPKPRGKGVFGKVREVLGGE